MSNTPEVPEVTTPNKVAVKAALQEQLKVAREQAAAFESEAVSTILDIIKDPNFRSHVAAIQNAADDLITPGIKLHVLNLLRGVQALDKLASYQQTT